jgi:hypothetical protein
LNQRVEGGRGESDTEDRDPRWIPGEDSYLFLGGEEHFEPAAPEDRKRSVKPAQRIGPIGWDAMQRSHVVGEAGERQAVGG